MPPKKAAEDAAPSVEEMEAQHLDGAELSEHVFDQGHAPDEMLYDGEILTTGMTLAVVLPGDNAESYFKAQVTARKQPDEDDAALLGRTIAVVRETCLGQIDDAIDATAEFAKNLAARGQ